MTTFFNHCISIIPISTLFTVVTCCVPQTFQALSCEGITVAIFLRVYIAIALTRSAGLSRHKWISIVTISTPAPKIKNFISWNAIMSNTLPTQGSISY